MAYTPEKFTEELQKAFGKTLKSVVLYGSAAAGNHHPKHSDFNVLIVLEQLTSALFKEAAHIIRYWTRQENPPPLIFTRDELHAFDDVFPLELLDMVDHRRVLYGEDPLVGFAPNSRNLRLELERELRSNLLKLRQAYALTCDSPKKIRQLMIEASSTFLLLFRGILRFLNIQPLPPKPEIAKALAQQFPMDVGVFDYLERLKAGEKSARKENPDLWMERFFEVLDVVIKKVDFWTESRN